MLDTSLKQEFRSIVRGGARFDELMREHTTIKIGGPADIWFEPADDNDLLNAVMWLDKNSIPKFIFGNGSNILVRDGGINGAVITLSKFDWLKTEKTETGCRISVGAGLPLQRLVSWSAENSLSGLETLVAIPGTVGGAIFMNAGTKEGSIGDAILNVNLLNRGKMTTVKKEKLGFGYRKTGIPRSAVIVGAELLLSDGDKTEIESRIQKLKSKRKEIQPLLWPSMGSVFKNPPTGSKAWQLIDDCGLRGIRVGGARISSEHANWIVNEGQASAKDVEVLVKMVKEHVKEKYDISLETEIVVIGE